MRPCPWPVSDLLPHAHPMILIDEAVGWDSGSFVAAVTVRAGRPFVRTGRGAPAHLAIEWMAQTCGAYIGAEALAGGDTVSLGFLLGTRDFKASVPWFAEGERLEITATLVFHEGTMAVFDCGVAQTGRALAKAQLTLYQPEDAAALLAAQTTGN